MRTTAANETPPHRGRTDRNDEAAAAKPKITALREPSRSRAPRGEEGRRRPRPLPPQARMAAQPLEKSRSLAYAAAKDGSLPTVRISRSYPRAARCARAPPGRGMTMLEGRPLLTALATPKRNTEREQTLPNN